MQAPGTEDQSGHISARYHIEPKSVVAALSNASEVSQPRPLASSDARSLFQQASVKAACVLSVCASNPRILARG